MVRMTTKTYPTRYAAHDAQGILHVYDGDKDAVEIACYSAPVTNTRYPHIQDGLWGSVNTLHPASQRGYYAEVLAVRPDISRLQKVWSETFKPDHYGGQEEAKQAAIDWLAKHIPVGEKWLARPGLEVVREAGERIIAEADFKIETATEMTDRINARESRRGGVRLLRLAEALEREGHGNV